MPSNDEELTESLAKLLGVTPERMASMAETEVPTGFAARIRSAVEEARITAEAEIAELARAYDAAAFEDHPAEQRRTFAAIQWAARRKLATDAAERAHALGYRRVTAFGPRPETFVRCSYCGHAPHGPVCLNMASDNECECRHAGDREVVERG